VNLDNIFEFKDSWKPREIKLNKSIQINRKRSLLPDSNVVLQVSNKSFVINKRAKAPKITGYLPEVLNIAQAEIPRQQENNQEEVYSFGDKEEDDERKMDEKDFTVITAKLTQSAIESKTSFEK
jgi:hypothetical protein